MTDNTVYIYSYIIYISEGHDPSLYRYFFHEQSIFFYALTVTNPASKGFTKEID